MKKNKPRLPTVEDFLSYRPRRGDFPWTTNEHGLVMITVPKFTSKLGVSLCKMVNKENVFCANLDKIGSLVWSQCDGDTTVQQILEHLQTTLPNEKDIDQRLFLFLQQMNALHYLSY